MRRELMDFVGCAVAAPSDGIFHPATITGLKPDETEGELIRVRFDGTSVEQYFNKTQLVGKNLTDVKDVRLQPDQNVFLTVDGKEIIGIIRSTIDTGAYVVAIEGRQITVEIDQIRLLKNTMGIRNRTQSDATRRRPSSFASASSSEHRSKDEFDVARTLASLSREYIDFDDMNEKNYEVNEREKKLAQLSRDRNSVICENPSSSLSASSSSYDAPNHPSMEDESDVDSDIDVERIDDDPLAEIDNACDDMEIDQAHSPKQYVSGGRSPSVTDSMSGISGFSRSIPIVPSQVSGWGTSPQVIAGIQCLRITGTPNGTPISSNSPKGNISAHSVPIPVGTSVFGTATRLLIGSPSLDNQTRFIQQQVNQYHLSPNQFSFSGGGGSPSSAAQTSMSLPSRGAETIAPPPQFRSSGVAQRIGDRGVTKRPGDGKKCRKIYGVENRHKWCSQCRWKKACQAFTD